MVDTNSDLYKKVQSIIAENLDIDEAEVKPEASFRTDLGADSLATYELVYAIENEMGVKIPDEVANQFEKVEDAYKYIEEHQA